MEPVERLRRTLFSIQLTQSAWRFGSASVSIISVFLIALTVAYKLRGSEPPSSLMLALLLAFATVVLLLSRFLHLAHVQQSQTRAAFNASEGEFQSVFENALEGILILDDDAICLEANPAAEQLFGLQRRKLIGCSIKRMYKDQNHFRSSWQQLLSNKFYRGEAELLPAQGPPIFVEFSAKADCLPGRHVMILHDVTERRLAQLSLQESEESARSASAEAEALRKATLALTQDLRMDYVMDTLLRSLMDLVPYTCARVLVPEGGTWVQSLGERTAANAATQASPPIHLNADKAPILKRILSEQKSILVQDTSEQNEWKGFTGHEDLRSWLSVPLVASDQYLGFLSIGHREPNRFTNEHLRRAELLAIPAAAAIQNARLYQTAQIYGSELQKRGDGKPVH